MVFVSVLFFIYHNTDNYKMYRIKNNVIDTTKLYMIAPRYIERRIYENDTIFYFYNSDKDLVIRIKKDSLVNYKIVE